MQGAHRGRAIVELLNWYVCLACGTQIRKVGQPYSHWRAWRTSVHVISRSEYEAACTSPDSSFFLHIASAETMSSVIIITGAVSSDPVCRFRRLLKLRSRLQNRGVGLGIVHLLSASQKPYTLYLTSRAGDNFPAAKAPHIFHPVKLDITDPSSIKAFAARVEKEQGKNGVDVLINNAGLNIENPEGGGHIYDKDNVKETMRTNYYGSRNVRIAPPPQELIELRQALTYGGTRCAMPSSRC